MIALTGSHASGKTTLARAYAERHRLHFMPSRAGKVFRRLGLPMGKLAPADRRRAQDAILATWEADVLRQPGPWIADRSPIDMAVYALLDLAGTGAESAWCEEYLARCLEACSRLVTAVVLLRPGIPFVPAPGRYAPCFALQEAADLCMFGLVNDSRLCVPTYSLARETTALEERLSALHVIASGVQRVYAQAVERLGGRDALH